MRKKHKGSSGGRGLRGHGAASTSGVTDIRPYPVPVREGRFFGPRDSGSFGGDESGRELEGGGELSMVGGASQAAAARGSASIVSSDAPQSSSTGRFAGGGALFNFHATCICRQLVPYASSPWLARKNERSSAGDQPNAPLTHPLAPARLHNASATMPCTGTAPQCQHHNALHWHSTTMPASQCLALAQILNALHWHSTTMPASQCLALAQILNALHWHDTAMPASQCLALA